MQGTFHPSLFLAVLIGLGWLAACGGGSTSSPTSAPPSAPTQSSGGQSSADQASDLLKCDPAALSFPLPSDLSECQHLDVITNFRTGMTQDQVMQFYRDYFQKNGWQPVGDQLPGLQLWTNGTERYQVIVAIEKGMTTVQIGGPVKQQ